MMLRYLLLNSFIVLVLGYGVFDWMKYDNFDRVQDLMEAVTEWNCASKSKEELMLPEDAVSNLVYTNKLKTSDLQANYYRNRSALLQLHQVVLSNAFKFSFLFQRLNQTWNFMDQPSLFYYYLGLTADVTANSGLVNGSAIFFDNHLFYPNFYTQIAVNQTIPLFGPRSWRIDDYNDASNWLREPTNDTFKVTDYGAGPLRNYTIDAYKINEWYKPWLPHPVTEKDDTKSDEWSVDMTYSDVPGSVRTEGDTNVKFFGPIQPLLSDPPSRQPVRFTRPYFDCGRSNKWIVSATAPIYDRLPRYVYDPNVPGNVSAGIYDNLRMNRRVGVAVADVDFLEIDFNPCSRYDKDDGPNYFAGTDRCHRESTYCKPLFGFGYVRGGYMCECRPGYRYPEYIQGPYYGFAIEQATEDEWKKGFHCIPIGDMFEVPELNAMPDDNSGLGRLPGSVQNRKRREAETQTAEERKKVVKELEEQKEKVGKAILGLTKYANSTSRFLRKVIPRNYNTLREIKEGRRQYVAKFSSIPDSLKEHLVKTKSDLGLGDRGRDIVSRYKRDVQENYAKLSRKKRNAFNADNLDRIQQMFLSKRDINAANCAKHTPQQLQLPGDVKFGIEKKLERYGRIGLRLADFLSSFLQNIDGNQDYGTLRGDRLLKEDQLFSEVLSVVLAEPNVKGIGLFFDTDQFKTLKTEKLPTGYSRSVPVTKQLFAPYAYQYANLNAKKDDYYAIDRASEPTPYTEKEWFRDIKRRWSYNTEGLKRYVLNPWVRADVVGKNVRRHEDFPLLWYSPVYESGIWSDPYFDCDGYIKNWIVSYRLPFFGNRGYGSPVEFRGVVTVDVKLNVLDVDQCPSDFFASNAFMGTARCDYETTYCVPIENRGFQLHQGYRCNCKQGYEYPWKGANEYFYTGDLIEDMRRRAVANTTTRWGRLNCRWSAGNHITYGSALLIISLLFSLALN